MTFDADNLFSLNRYAYANNNPYKYTDPDGNFAWFALFIFISKEAASEAFEHATGIPLPTVKNGIKYGGKVLAKKAIAEGVEKSLKDGTYKTVSEAAKKQKKGYHKIDLKRKNHIFRDKEGHIKDTSNNRKLLESVANDPSTTLGNNKYGNTWSSQIRADGTQVWTEVRNGKIINGGVNKTPKTFNSKTCLSAPQKTKQRKSK